MAWCQSHGAEVNKKVNFFHHDVVTGIRGAVAKQHIRKGDLLLRIPLDLVLQANKKTLAEFPALRSPLTQCALLLMHHCYLQASGEKTGGTRCCLCSQPCTCLPCNASFWRPYLATLREVELDMPCFWTAEEKQELRGTSVSARKLGGTKESQHFSRHILPGRRA